MCPGTIIIVPLARYPSFSWCADAVTIELSNIMHIIAESLALAAWVQARLFSWGQIYQNQVGDCIKLFITWFDLFQFHCIYIMVRKLESMVILFFNWLPIGWDIQNTVGFLFIIFQPCLIPPQKPRFHPFLCLCLSSIGIFGLGFGSLNGFELRSHIWWVFIPSQAFRPTWDIFYVARMCA